MLDKLLIFVLVKLIRAKERFRNALLDFILDNPKDVEEDKKETFTWEDLEEAEEEAEYILDSNPPVPLMTEPTDFEFGGKLVTVYMPNNDNETTTVATFPVNKYIARILDSEDFEHEHFKPDAIKEVISMCMEAKEYTEGIDWNTQEDDEDDDIYS